MGIGFITLLVSFTKRWIRKMENISALFGNKEIFAIEYTQLDEDFWCEFKIWVNNVDVCQHQYEGRFYNLEGDLYKIMNWIATNGIYFMGYDPFPLPVKGNNLEELLEKAFEFESEDDIEDHLWYNARSEWILKHCWLSIKGEEILPSIYFARSDDIIEIYCNNDDWAARGILFTKIREICTVPYRFFRDTIRRFLQDAIVVLKNNGIKTKEIEVAANYLEL